MNRCDFMMFWMRIEAVRNLCSSSELAGGGLLTSLLRGYFLMVIV